MKRTARMIGRILLIAAALLLVAASALATDVRITGECNVRRGPGLNYGVIETVRAGDILEYWEEMQYDERGVAWYNVIYGNLSAWVSSKYAVLESDYPSAGGGGANNPSSGSAVEVAQYYGKDIRTSADALGGGFAVEYMDGEDNIDVIYSGDQIAFLAHGTTIQEIQIYGAGYSLKGVTVGMNRSGAQSKLSGYAVMDDYGDTVIYAIEGTASQPRIMMAVEYNGSTVTRLDYGIWS